MFLLEFLRSANLAQHFAANRASKSARGAELCQICQGDPQRAFSEILQSWEQVKLVRKNTLTRMPAKLGAGQTPAKRRPEKTP